MLYILVLVRAGPTSPIIASSASRGPRVTTSEELQTLLLTALRYVASTKSENSGIFVTHSVRVYASRCTYSASGIRGKRKTWAINVCGRLGTSSSNSTHGSCNERDQGLTDRTMVYSSIKLVVKVLEIFFFHIFANGLALFFS